jgi:hypothetical protein
LKELQKPHRDPYPYVSHVEKIKLALQTTTSHAKITVCWWGRLIDGGESDVWREAERGEKIGKGGLSACKIPVEPFRGRMRKTIWDLMKRMDMFRFKFIDR